MNSGQLNKKIQHEPDTTPFGSGVVIAAEIAFAALLLYLTNHPIELHDLDQTVAQNGVQSEALTSNSLFNARVIIVDYTTKSTEVAVASTSLSIRSDEHQIQN